VMKEEEGGELKGREEQQGISMWSSSARPSTDVPHTTCQSQLEVQTVFGMLKAELKVCAHSRTAVELIDLPQCLPPCTLL
jgi:hypothetical protein